MLSLGLLDGLLDLLLLDLLAPLLAHGDAALFDVVALDDLVVPEISDFLLFILLRRPQVGSHLLQVQSTIGLITVSHELVSTVALIPWLELEVGDGLRGQVHLD